jgi:hypothetical protein
MALLAVADGQALLVSFECFHLICMMLFPGIGLLLSSWTSGHNNDCSSL